MSIGPEPEPQHDAVAEAERVLAGEDAWMDQEIQTGTPLRSAFLIGLHVEMEKIQAQEEGDEHASERTAWIVSEKFAMAQFPNLHDPRSSFADLSVPLSYREVGAIGNSVLRCLATDQEFLYPEILGGTVANRELAQAFLILHEAFVFAGGRPRPELDAAIEIFSR